VPRSCGDRYADEVLVAVESARRPGLRSSPLGDETPIYNSESQFEAWKHTDLTIDVVPAGAGCSRWTPVVNADSSRDRRSARRAKPSALRFEFLPPKPFAWVR
jgi:hypothetical protein